MALTIAALATGGGTSTGPVEAVPGGKRREAFVQITFDASYPTGGYALTAAQFNLSLGIQYVKGAVTLSGRLCAYNPATGKLKVFSAVSTEVGNGTDLSADSVLAEVVGY